MSGSPASRPTTPSRVAADLEVPLLRHRAVDDLRLSSAPVRARHTVDVGVGGVSLDFYADLVPSDVLHVVLHGADSPSRHFYPRFERIRSLTGKVGALVCFADPTMRVSHDMLLAWYLGARGWDPGPWIHDVTRQVQQVTGARNVIFIGGSGGGYAALRLAHTHRGAGAFVQAPQTSIARYARSVVDTYLDRCWGPGVDMEVLATHRTRFDMTYLYSQRRSDALVYYLQSRGDAGHVVRHYEPFRDACLRSPLGPGLSRRLRLVEFDSDRPGHGPPTPAEFDHHLAEAQAFFATRWRDRAHLGAA